MKFLLIIDNEKYMVTDPENIVDWWVSVTVIINEYHTLGDPSFKLDFRMTRGVFEVSEYFTFLAPERYIQLILGSCFYCSS